jgi:hypothetical protein
VKEGEKKIDREEDGEREKEIDLMKQERENKEEGKRKTEVERNIRKQESEMRVRGIKKRG